MALNEQFSLADAIVGQATEGPSLEGSRRRAKGLMAKATEETYTVDQVQAEIDQYTPELMSFYKDEIRSNRSSFLPKKEEYEVAELDYSDLEDDYGEDARATRPDQDYVKPRLRGDAGSLSFEDLALKVQRDSGDGQFKDKVRALADKYNITTQEIYAVINGENKDWSWNTTNKLGYKGLFQIGETPALEAGIDYASITSMTPSQQVDAYDKYLSRWSYDGSVPLAVMQAAPGKAKRLKGKPSSTVVYAVGSDAWKENPAWRSSKNGPITLGSLKNYYR
jgi:hypothetical protein